MKQLHPIYLVVGVPGSGKSWVCDQLKDKYNYLKHDDYMKDTPGYIRDAARLAADSEKPVLIETPFSVSQTGGKLLEMGYRVIPVFILESEVTTAERYFKREGKDIPKGHLTRIQTYRERCEEYNAFGGTSEQVLEHLKKQVK